MESAGVLLHPWHIDAAGWGWVGFLHGPTRPGRLAEATGRMVEQQVSYADQSGKMFGQTASLIAGANGLLEQHARRLQQLETTLHEQTRSQKRTAQIAGRV